MKIFKVTYEICGDNESRYFESPNIMILVNWFGFCGRDRIVEIKRVSRLPKGVEPAKAY